MKHFYETLTPAPSGQEVRIGVVCSHSAAWKHFGQDTGWRMFGTGVMVRRGDARSSGRRTSGAWRNWHQQRLVRRAAVTPILTRLTMPSPSLGTTWVQTPPSTALC